MKKIMVLTAISIVIAGIIWLGFSKLNLTGTTNHPQYFYVLFGFFLTLVTASNVIGLPYLIKEMAKNDFIFTLVDEGTAKAIMGAGDSGFQKIIYQFKDYELDNDWNVAPSQADDHQKFSEKVKDFFGLSGVKLLGIPGLHSIHNYIFRWNSLKQSAEKGTIEAGGLYYTPHKDNIDYILLQSDVYYGRVEQAEDKNMVPLDLDITIEVRIVNPYKALFARQEWLEMTWSVVLPSLRRFTSTQKWEDLAKRTKEKQADFITSVQDNFDMLREEVGVEIVNFYIIRIRPAGKRAEMYEEAATKEFETRKEAIRIGILAKAEQNRIKKVYGEIKEFDELGQMIRRLEALEKASEGNGNTIISAPELAGIATAVKAISQATS